MTRAMERHRSGEAQVIPVILRPRYWQGLPFERLLATPTDGKAVTKLPNQDDVFLEVTKAINAAAETLSAAQGRETTESVSTGPSSNPISGTRKPKAAIGSRVLGTYAGCWI